MPLINAQNIKKSFGQGDLITHVLKGITMTVTEGEFLAIMGKSGAGKSTLMYQLACLDQPTSGTITIDGVTTTTLSEKEKTHFRLETLGFVFQNYALVPDLSARENVMLPLLLRNMNWLEASQTADDTLDTVGLQDRYLNTPAELSGGEQQRVAVARAVAGKPTILFADEPTANLDSVSGRELIELFTMLHQEYQQTIVMVTHEAEYTHSCDRILNMTDGLLD